MSRPLPPLVRATLAFSGGLLLSFSVPSLDLTALALGTGVAWCALGAGAGRLGLALFALLGTLLGGGAVASARADCRAHLADGARLHVRGVFETLAEPGGTAILRLERAVGPGSPVCRGAVRARLARHAGPVAAGETIEGRGRWWSNPAAGRWPRSPSRAGTLLLDHASAPAGETPRHPLLAARGAAQERLRRLLGPRSSMAEALLLAERGGLDPAARDRFAMAGLSHLLAISGLHVGLVAGSLLLVGRLLGLSATAAALAAAAVTLGYVLFLGAPPAATRAALQVGLLLGSRLMQRPADPLALVAAAGLVLLVRDPLALLDPGFQLSFSGVLGLALLAPRMRRARPAGGAVRRAVRDALVVNTAATLATAPIAALHFGRFAGIGILANLVAVPLVSLAVPSLALAFLGSLVAWPVGAFLAGAPVPLLDALDLVARVAAAVPHGSVIVSRDVLWSWLLALGCALGMLSLLPAAAGAAGRRRARRWAAGGAAAAIFIAWPVLARGVGGERLEIHAIDVGQGDAIAIRSPAGRWALVDAGPRTLRRDAGRAEVVPFLLRHGVRRLELLVLTHPDADHIGGAAAILSMLRVGVVLDPGRAEGKPLYLEAIQAAGEDGSRWRAARAGRELELDGAVIRVLYPPAEPLDATAEANAVSVVLALEYGEFRALLLGDAPMEVEERLVETEGERLRADVLKVGHHGSATSSGAALLRAASPRLAVIPVGRGNRYGHPEADVLERLDAAGARILRTDRDGTISIRVRPNGEWTVETQR